MTTTKDIRRVDSMLLAEYILERGGKMSHLKLQKILYYIQALHLAYFDQPIIEDEFQAWLHGPVSRRIYDQIKGVSILYTEINYDVSTEGPRPSDLLKEQLTEDQLDLVNEVIEEYGQLTSSQLERLTHSEDPWINARKGYGVAERCEEVIPKDSMRVYYKKAVYGEDC